MPVNKRNTSIWKPFTTLSYMGIADPLLDNEVVLNDLGQSLIGGAVTIVDDEIRIKEEQRDALIKLGYDTITNEMTLTDMDAATRRTVMALEIAANDYMMLVENYIVEVLNLITDAKEYAFEMGKNAIELAQVKAEIAEEKGAIYIQKVDLQIQLEVIERKHVEIELLRAELAVAKAHTQLLMAEIDVSKAELALVETQVKAAMAEVEKTQIEVDIAMTIADIATKELSAVKYSVEVAEIAASFEIIASKLSAVLDILTEKQTQLGHQTASKTSILGDIKGLTSADKEAQSQRVDAASSDKSVAEYEASETVAAIAQESSQVEALTAALIAEIAARTQASISVDEAQALAAALVNLAHAWASDNKEHLTASTINIGHHVHPNASVFCGAV